MSKGPFYPIVYVRGYAGTQAAVEDAAADPYMGFNSGSTKLRQNWQGGIEKHIFESPLLRLIKDYGYQDAHYADGEAFQLTNNTQREWKSIWIYRYYEAVSKDLGSGKRPEIEDYAQGLGQLLRNIRDALCGDDAAARKEFKVYLVAHSMGGLVVRSWLQNFRTKENDPVAVEKIFTYASPHRGIDLQLIGNIPEWFKFNNADNFSEDRMREYLKIPKNKAVNSLNGKFDPNKFFSLIGTNAKDYDEAAGLSRRAVGPLSDGLVQIANAYVDSTPRAFVHRAHSGHFGIVNSEEGYQNMVRFFFGDMRVDGLLTVSDLPLPKKVQKAKDDGKEIRASYHFEVATTVRGARWHLHRRMVKENCAILAKYDDMVKDKKPLHLFSTFLSKSAITNNSRYMSFAINLGLMVPEYSIDKLLFDEHYEGSYIFNDVLTLDVTQTSSGEFKARYGWDSNSVNDATKALDIKKTAKGWECKLPVEKKGAPGITAELTLVCQAV